MTSRNRAIDQTLQAFIRAQRLFFVAPAPLDPNGPVNLFPNLFPKGLDSFRLFGPKTVAYLDRFGGAMETVAHLRENGRIVLTFCSFEGPPKILGRHGHGRVSSRTRRSLPDCNRSFRSAQARGPASSSS